MFDPMHLLLWSADVSPDELRSANGKRPVLLVTMDGPTNAGGIHQLISARILDGFSFRKIASFDIDQLYNYAESRPKIVFDHDHFRGYEAPELSLYIVHDADDVPFLLLDGNEPGLAWERMSEAVGAIVDELDVEKVCTVQSIPAPTPHTRPVFVSGYATDPEFMAGVDGIPATVMMDSTFQAMMTTSLDAKGIDVVGLVAHVPHYLAGMEYPAAAIALLDGLTKVSPIDIPAGHGLEARSAATMAMIEQQVSNSHEASELIERMEEQYEQFMAERSRAAHIELPSADEIGAEVEDFLRNLGDDRPDA